MATEPETPIDSFNTIRALQELGRFGALAMKTPTNFFHVGVRFKTHAYSVQDRGREGFIVTPEIVLAELEEFCQRIRRDLEKARTTNAVDPVEGSGQEGPRAPESSRL